MVKKIKRSEGLPEKSKQTFREMVRGLFSYEKSPNLVPMDLLKKIVYKINPSYQVVGLVGIGLEGAVVKVLDIANIEIALKIGSVNFSEEGKKKRKIYSLFKFKTETENGFQTRAIEGSKVQKIVSDLIVQEQIDYLIVPSGVEVSLSPGLYIKMEYIHGPPILVHLKDINSFPYSLHLYVQLLKSVEFFHNYGYIHRDLKSANIIITGVGQKKPKICVLDWTMAKQCGVDSATIAGMSLGTLGHASPKLSLEGNAKSANYSDDIYSLGMMLYEFCTSKALPRTKNPTILLHDRLAVVQYVAEVEKSIPPFLIPIFRKATNIEEDKRYQTLAPFIYEFTEVLKREKLFEVGGWEFSEKDPLELLQSRVEDLEKFKSEVTAKIEELYKRMSKIVIAANGADDFKNTQRIPMANLETSKKPSIEFSERTESPSSTAQAINDNKSDIEEHLDIIFPDDQES